MKGSAMAEQTQADAKWLWRQADYVQQVFREVGGITHPDHYVAFKPIMERTKLARGPVRLACRSLRRRGLLAYQSGLWDDCGYPRGAGYGVTETGLDLWNQLMGYGDD